MAPHGERPLASILIVAWRLVDELRDCLDSLAASVDRPTSEVIVVLNGASEQVAAVARSHAIVDQVVERLANIGFGAACNLASAVATGENLIFLNDDTRVDPYWLATIVDAKERMGAAGVASLLLNFDGTVQEAGSRLLTHGGTHQLGRGMTLEEAGEVGLIESRTIDYGSAAALLIDREDFAAVGGFDPLYEPAYFEDVDLQLRLRERGGRIVLEPGAKVLHHSGRSTQADHWFRQFAANRSGFRFIERWQHVLVTAPAPDDPLAELCVVPLFDRPSARAIPDSIPSDRSSQTALAFARDFQAWLVDQLDQHIEVRHEFASDPMAPSRRQLLSQRDESRERVHLLTARLEDLEQRNPLGIAKMRVGVWLNERRRSSADGGRSVSR